MAKHGFIIFIRGCYFTVKQFLKRMRVQTARKVSMPDVGISRTVEKKIGDSRSQIIQVAHLESIWIIRIPKIYQSKIGT